MAPAVGIEITNRVSNPVINVIKCHILKGMLVIKCPTALASSLSAIWGSG